MVEEVREEVGGGEGGGWEEVREEVGRRWVREVG